MTDATDDHDLLHRARAGDDAARDSLWRAHRRWVAAILLAERVAPSNLEDVLQDVALNFVRGLSKLSEVAAFRSWLRTVAQNAARSAARRDAVRRADRSWGDAAIEPADDKEIGRSQAKEDVDAILQLLDALPAELREALWLRAVEGQTQRAIAAALGVPETTVETRLARARRRLREALAGEPTQAARLTRVTKADP